MNATCDLQLGAVLDLRYEKTYSPPKLPSGETRDDRTDKVVKEILEDEAVERQTQTERLRALRLERDKSEGGRNRR